MPETVARQPWARVGAWVGLVGHGRIGLSDGPPGLLVEPRDGLGLATLIGRDGREDQLASRLRARFGLALPSTPRFVGGPELSFAWSGRQQWLAISERPGLAERLRRDLDGFAAACDQSDGRAIVRLSGPRVRDVLAKGCMVDLHPRAFKPGDVALTSIAHIGVQLWQGMDGASFHLAVPRSLAGSLWSWLEASAIEFGCNLTGGASSS